MRQPIRPSMPALTGLWRPPRPDCISLPAVLGALEERGIERAEVTLHVSAGTFRPVKSELIGDHMMHTEHFLVSRDTLKRLRGRKITCSRHNYRPHA